MADEEEEPPLAIQIDQTVGEPSQSSSEQPPYDNVSVGVTVITGYLGAGKSTLVNYILNAQHGKRIAVILNEFGEEIGVERAMINEGESGALVEEWVELANGCVCCTVKHSLVQALEQLVQMKKRLDHILLETTGLANPAPLASVLWLDDQLESSVKLDSIVTVVDAKNLRFQLNTHRDSTKFPEAFLQIAFADVVILNKVDLVSSEGSEGAVEDLEKEIRSINSLANIVRSVRCQVDLSLILNRQAYDATHASHLEALLEESKSIPSKDLHDSGVRTLCINQTEAVDLNKVRLWIEEILWEKKYGMDVYRCKGVLSIQNSDNLHTLQAVREIYEIVPARQWRKEEKQMNRIVFIESLYPRRQLAAKRENFSQVALPNWLLLLFNSQQSGMALVVICGQPCSGKSTAAKCLAEALNESECKQTVRIIDETSFHLDRNQSYANMPAEKNLRGVLRSEVDRSVSKDNIIIVDSLNSIKGYRYELWCLARAAGVRYCVLYCDVEEAQCRKWNEERREKGEAAYNDVIFEDLARRFETPDRRNRWDSPLYELWPHKDGVEKSSVAIADAVSYLTKKVDSKSRDVKILQPTIATQNTRFSEANSLYEMDRATQEVINAIVEAQSQAIGGPLVGISIGQGLPTIDISRSVGLPELRRLRRTFIKLTGQTSLSGRPPPSDAESTKRMFIDYLNRELGSTA
ncbi:hypothetical protein CCACVL1_06500 [Corchorus capsularis]|uniref:Protein KTI12 homolog n=1 Tax=Corchorus capsularis TaxID=210143 RepID=A0A1R3JEZ9_COCAP|nr:hypothetical protein CCACVL1_06500 [Corchorus capsularis]